MKIQTIALRLLALAVVAFALLPAQAQDKKKRTAGPNGGRVIETLEPRAEFFVTADRKVQITFLDKAGKPIAPADQVVAVTAGKRSAPTKLAFARSGDALVSTTPLPPGDDLPAVVQIKPAPSGKTVTERITVDLSVCGECKLTEYACTCAH